MRRNKSDDGAAHVTIGIRRHDSHGVPQLSHSRERRTPPCRPAPRPAPLVSHPQIPRDRQSAGVHVSRHARAPSCDSQPVTCLCGTSGSDTSRGACGGHDRTVTGACSSCRPAAASCAPERRSVSLAGPAGRNAPALPCHGPAPSERREGTHPAPHFRNSGAPTRRLRAVRPVPLRELARSASRRRSEHSPNNVGELPFHSGRLT